MIGSQIFDDHGGFPLSNKKPCEEILRKAAADSDYSYCSSEIMPCWMANFTNAVISFKPSFCMNRLR